MPWQAGRSGFNTKRLNFKKLVSQVPERHPSGGKALPEPQPFLICCCLSLLSTKLAAIVCFLYGTWRLLCHWVCPAPQKRIFISPPPVLLQSLIISLVKLPRCVHNKVQTKERVGKQNCYPKNPCQESMVIQRCSVCISEALLVQPAVQLLEGKNQLVCKPAQLPVREEK